MRAVVVALYALAFALPAFALWRVWRQARRAVAELGLSEGAAPTFDDFDKLLIASKQTPSDAVVGARREFVMVGAGLLCGAVASIWSLFL